MQCGKYGLSVLIGDLSNEYNTICYSYGSNNILTASNCSSTFDIFRYIISNIMEPMKVANNIWCTIIDYIKKHISKKREDKDISNLEL